MRNWKLESGRLIDDYQLSLAYEVFTGKVSYSNEEESERWIKCIPMTPLRSDDGQVEDLVCMGYTIRAVKAYKDTHNCSVKEAQDAVRKLQEKIGTQ